MKPLNCFILLVVALSSQVIAEVPKSRQLDNVFYCFNNAGKLANAPKTREAQASALKEMGYGGMAGYNEATYHEMRRATGAAGLTMPDIYIGLIVGEDGKATYREELKGVLEDSADTDLLMSVWLVNRSSIKDRGKLDRAFVETLRELADFCHPLGIRIAVYPHVNNHCETIGHAVDLTKAVNRRNAGIVFNTCHFWKVEGSGGWKDALRLAKPCLFLVSINGIDAAEDTRKLGWDTLVQPLGEGSFDVYEVVKFAKDLGYEGAFGLQCAGMSRDFGEAMKQSLDTWKSYQERYLREQARE